MEKKIKNQQDIQNQQQIFNSQQIKPFKIKRTQSIMSATDQKPLPFLLKKAIDYFGREHFAIALVIFAQFTYPTGFLYSNQNNLHFIQTTLVRGIASLFMIYPIIIYNKVSLDFKYIEDLNLLNTRNIIIVLHSFVFTLVQFYLEQPILQTINSCGPIFIFVIDYLMNGVKINHKQFIGVLLAMFGVLLTVNGEAFSDWLFNRSQDKGQSQFKNYYTTNPAVKVLAGFMLLLAIALWGYGQVITKKIKTINFLHINMHLAIYLTVFSAVFYPILVTHPVQISKMLWALIMCGIPTTVASFCFIGAVTISKHTGVLTLFIFVSVLVGYFVSIFRYKQSLNLLCISGTILLVTGLFKTVMNKDKQS